MGRIRRLPLANEDLISIWHYVAQDDPGYADALLDSLLEKLRLLSDSPMLGRARPEFAPALRSFVVGNYVLFYEPEPGGILLIRARHGARDATREPSRR